MMKHGWVFLWLGVVFCFEVHAETKAGAQARIRGILKDVAIQDELVLPRHEGDWLIRPPETTSSLNVCLAEDSATLVLANGLISRRFHVGENLVCYSLRREDTVA